MGNSEMYFKKTKVGVNNLIFFGCKDYIQIHYACNEGKKSLSRSHPGCFCVSLSHVLKSFLFLGGLRRRTLLPSFSCFSCQSCPPFGHLGWALWPLALIKKWGTLRRRRPYFDDWFPNFFHSKMLHFWRPLKSISGCRTQHFAVEGKSTTSCWKWISI